MITQFVNGEQERISSFEFRDWIWRYTVKSIIIMTSSSSDGSIYRFDIDISYRVILISFEKFDQDIDIFQDINLLIDSHFSDLIIYCRLLRPASWYNTNTTWMINEQWMNDVEAYNNNYMNYSLHYTLYGLILHHNKWNISIDIKSKSRYFQISHRYRIEFVHVI